MLVLALTFVCMLFRVTVCDQSNIISEAVLMTSFIVLRVLHLPIMILAICCCAPCYLCPSTCVVKRWLIGKRSGVDARIFELIDQQKWIFRNNQDLRNF